MRSQSSATDTGMGLDFLNPHVTLYGSSISYFTGKMENYFRVRGIPYVLESMQFPSFVKRMEREVGLWQMPAVQLSDGRWMTDSTRMIQWFEEQLPDEGLIPKDPVVAFFCYLLEDWADEWWWRPAMHYRWHYEEGARFASWHLADELMGAIPLPMFLKRRYVQYRQRSGYTRGDGITPACVPAVEAGVDRLLDQLNGIFSRRPFLLGERPTLADIGFSGPFFRHFALDPIPLERIRQRAPAVLAWVGRLWNARISDYRGCDMRALPEDIGPLLDDIGASYLPYLCANVEAVQSGRKQFDIDVDGAEFRGARYSRYRVWCLQELRDHYHALPSEAQEHARALLEKHQCWEPLFRIDPLPLLPNQDRDLPFHASTKMIGVHE